MVNGEWRLMQHFMLLRCKIETVTQRTGITVGPWYGVQKSWDNNKLLLLGEAQAKTMHRVHSKLMEHEIYDYIGNVYFVLPDYLYERTIFKNKIRIRHHYYYCDQCFVAI